jgi:folate-binding protein YgfZ
MPVALLPDRALIRLTGPDAGSFLQGLVTQDVTSLRPGHWHWAALLSPQGKLMYDFLLQVDSADYLLDVEAAQRAALMKKLNLYKLRAAVTVHADDSAVVAGWNSPMPADAAQDSRHPQLGWRSRGVPVDDSAENYRQHRWSLGIAEGARELGQDRVLWLECNAAELGGVSFTKGCYVGQENTARMHHRHKLRKRIMMFAAAAPGDVVMADDKAAGDVMMQHGETGIALMRLESVDKPLSLGGSPLRLLRPDWLEPHLKTA